jgi:FAD/FMN-containing dehydrogenase
MGSFWSFVAVLIAVAQLCVQSIAVSMAASNCKVIPGDPTWPAASIWKGELPTAMEQASGGKQKHATYRIDVQTVDEVTKAVKFASKHNIRLTLLNSGHDFLGRNDAPNGLVIVTTALKGIRLLTDFKPSLQGVPVVNTSTKIQPITNPPADTWVTFGVGYNTGELNKLLQSSKLVTLGAAHEGVSVAGGWGQNAGHAVLSPKYGLGADQFVEFKIITADGKMRVANSVSEPDLFWALRGGGGGTWGVVVEATVKTYPSSGIASSTFWINATNYNDQKSIYPAVAWLHTKIPEFADQGLTNYYYIYPNAFAITSVYPGGKGSKKWIDQKWQPHLRHLATFPGMSASSINYISFEYSNFYTWFDDTIVKRRPTNAIFDLGSLFGAKSGSISRRHGPGSEKMLTQSQGVRGTDSWLLGKDHLNSPKFAKVLEESMPRNMNNPQLRGQGVGGPGVFSRGNDTSVLAAWRKTYCHIIHIGSLDTDATPMRRLAPEMGAYANEASRDMPGWRKAFWGENYDRLSEIKKRYDPDHLFWVTPGIDADAWVVEGSRICRNTAPKVDVKSAETDTPPKNDNQNYVDGTAKGIDEYPGPQFMNVRGSKGSIFNLAYLSPN